MLYLTGLFEYIVTELIYWLFKVAFSRQSIGYMILQWVSEMMEENLHILVGQDSAL